MNVLYITCSSGCACLVAFPWFDNMCFCILISQLGTGLLLQTLISTAAKKGGLSTGDIAAQYKYKNTAVGLIVDTASNVFTTLRCFI